jgi:hypothetical protein
MPQLDAGSDQETGSRDSELTVSIDPKNFFHYASSDENRWQELVGFNISHCTFGLGTISKVEGEYIYVNLPERQGKKHLTEFGLESFLRGFFSNLLINNTLQQKIIEAADSQALELKRIALQEAEALNQPPKKKKRVTKATKKNDLSGKSKTIKEKI